MNTKVIVTGATGFLGFNLAQRLKELGYEVVGLGRNNEKGKILTNSRIDYVQADLCNLELLKDIFKKAEYVFHCAAKSSVWGNYESFYKPNIIGVKNVIEACRFNNVKRLLYVSSPSIYFDFKEKFNIKEDEHPTLNPANNYIKTKIEAEKLVDDAVKDGMDIITIRPRGIFGVGDTALLPRMIRANCEKFIPKTVKKDILIDITHVQNVVESLILAMNASENCKGQKYNITNGESIYFYETLEKLITSLGYEFNCKRMPYIFALTIAKILESVYKFNSKKEPVFTRYSVGLLSFGQTLDITKAKKELGYEPVVTMQQGLDEVIKDYKRRRQNASN